MPKIKFQNIFVNPLEKEKKVKGASLSTMIEPFIRKKNDWTNCWLFPQIKQRDSACLATFWGM